MKTYTVRAKRWDKGWELHVDGVGVTQSHSLTGAEDMARSYIAMMTGAASDAFTIDLRPEVDARIDADMRGAREAARHAEEAQAAAAKRLRGVVERLRGVGLTNRDIAAFLKVTPQRVSQLVSDRRRGARV